MRLEIKEEEEKEKYKNTGVQNIACSLDIFRRRDHA